MHASTTLAPAALDSAPHRPGVRRRTAVGAAAVVTLALPTIWTVGIARLVVTGAERDHLYHQLTGQGLLLMALWLGALVPLVRAGLSGQRPGTAPALQHVVFAAAAAGCAALAPAGGAPLVAGVIVVTGALLWLALPVRPRLRGVVGTLDPVLAPLALLTGALYAPFVIEQLALQNAATGYHAQNPHFFDMAWLAVTLVLLAAAASVVPSARRLALWTTLGSVVVGGAGLALTTDTTWSMLATALGVAGTAAVLARLRRGDVR